ncbi:MAG: hypothetical protein GC200_06510 [Tepidisphaera sp.]|nr:hypothetical protein [Tepidisphaera sp.]
MLSKTADSTIFSARPGYALAAALSLSLLAGCQSPVPRHNAGVFAGNAGASASVVFAGPELQVASGPETSRNDTRLAIREPESAYAQAAFASPTRPNLFRPYYLRVRVYNDDQIYFRQEYRRGGDEFTRYWGY